MPLNLAKLAANKAIAAVDFGGGNVLQVEYYPQRITPKMLLDLADLSDHAKTASEADVLTDLRHIVGTPAAMLASLLISWDAVEDSDDGAEVPLPLDLAHLLDLPLATQMIILNALIAEQSGEAKAPTGSGKARPSGATSSKRAK